MGLFDKLSGSSKVQLTPKSALALAAMTVISADGSIDDEEIDILKRILRNDDKSFDQAFIHYKDKSTSECIELVSSILNEQQKVATLANLLDIAMSDGVLAGAEKNLLEAYVTSFDINDDIINDLVDVISVKNDSSIFE